MPAPDTRVTSAENQQVRLIKGKTIDGFPTRPGYGTKGQRIVVRVNMFDINPNVDRGKAEVPLYKYNVDAGNEQLSRKKRGQLIHEIVQRPEFQETDWATDYTNIIVTTKKIPNTDGRVSVKDPNDDSFPDQPTTQEARAAVARRMKRFRVTYEDSFALSDLLAWLRRIQDGQVYAGRADLIQLLNIIVQKICRDNLLVSSSSGGQSSFFPIRGHDCFVSTDLGAGLSAY